jgi:hypothetical protein
MPRLNLTADLSASIVPRYLGAHQGQLPGTPSHDRGVHGARAFSISSNLIGVATIQRPNTTGSVAERACESAGTFANVSYSADYASATGADAEIGLSKARCPPALDDVGSAVQGSLERAFQAHIA